MPDDPRPRPRHIKTRWGRFREVFSCGRDAELHARIARLCVLFEDLRMEIAGMTALELGRLDDTSKHGRTLYFLRRSIATLHEFAETLLELDGFATFTSIRQAFPDLAARHWSRAIRYFRKHERYIARIRHHVSGHFGMQAAEQAISHLQHDACGSIDVSFYERGGGATLNFAGEIAATALLHNETTGHTSGSKIRNLMRRALIGYRHAVRAVDFVSATYVWDRFGR